MTKKEKVDPQMELIHRIQRTIASQREYMARTIHCLEYFEQQNQNSKIRFWLNQCIEDLKRQLNA